MYHKEFYPFYTAYAEAGLFDGQKVQDQEFELMKSYYPSAARRVQAQVEQECDLMDYEGSRIYDQYPDKLMLYHMCQKIREKVSGMREMEPLSGDFLDDLIQVLLFQEISRRRCRRNRCRGRNTAVNFFVDESKKHNIYNIREKRYNKNDDIRRIFRETDQ